MQDHVRAALYVRVSTEEQAEEGQSIDAQLGSLRAYAKAHHYEVVEEFADRGFSATTDRRPAFQQMIALAKRKPRPFDVILVHKQDRFARNREHAVVYKNLLRRECGVDVVSILEPFEDSPQGRLMEGLMEVMAEFYSANLSQEVLKGMRQKARSGAALGLPPLGFRIGADGILEPDEATVPVVKWIFEQYAAGRSLGDIARRLRLDGVSMFGPSLPGYRWSVPGVRVILTNEAYVGTKVWGLRARQGEEPIRVEGAHQALVSEDLFRMVQARLHANRGGRSKYGDYLLRGIVRCGACGGGMALVMQQSHARRSDGTRTARPILACSRYYKQTGECLPRNWVDMEVLERKIGEVLSGLIRDDSAMERLEWEFPDDLASRRLALERRLEAEDQAFKRQLVAYENGVLDLDDLREAKSRLIAERQRIEQELAELQRRQRARTLPTREVRRRLAGAVDALTDGTLPLGTRRSVLEAVLAGASWDRKTATLRLRLKAPEL